MLTYSFSALMISEVLRRTTVAIETNNLNSLNGIAIFAIILTLISVILEYLTAIINQSLQNNCEEHLQILLLNKIFHLKKLKFQGIKTGEIITKTTQYIPNAITGTITTVFNGIVGIFAIIFGIIYMSLLDIKLMLCIVIFNVLFRMFTLTFDKKIKQTAKQGVSIKNRNSSFALDLLNNNIIVKVFEKYEFFQNKFFKNETEMMNNDVRSFGLQVGYSELQWMTKMIITIIILYGFGGWLVAKGQLQFSVIIALTTSSDYFTKGINTMITALNAKNSSVPLIEAITELLNEEDVEKETEKLQNTDDISISFEKVSFGFGDKIILDNVSFTINAGEWVEISGPNGQGKSTLLNLILGYYRPSSGKIKFGDQEVTNVSLYSINGNYSYIPQDPHILEGSASENLALTESFDNKKTDSIISGLNLDEVKNNKPSSFSQGEKQRLTIGRALYRIKRTPLVLGDEIFSNIDNTNKKEIVNIISDACKGKTIFFVCHDDMGLKFSKKLIVKDKKVLIQPYEVCSENVGVNA